MNVQDDRGIESRRSRGKVRPRTIHIDVYCSTSSEDDSVGQYSSDDSPNPLTPRTLAPRTLVALGSKKNRKNEVDLRKRLSDEELPDGHESTNFIFQSMHRSRSPRHSAFITDVPLKLSSSPPVPPGSCTSVSQTTTSSASDATKILSTRNDLVKNLVRPSTLDIASFSSPIPLKKIESKMSTSVSLNSPLDFSHWEADPDIPSSCLSWRGSEFESFVSHLASDLETDSSQRRVSLTQSEIFYEGDSEGTEVESNTENEVASKFWRSPQLERRKYIQKGQEDRYKEAVKRRTQRSIEESTSQLPSDVDALSKLSVFKNFSTEELEVISKSLNKRESSVNESKNSSFKAIEKDESLKLLKRMSSFSESSPRNSLSKSNSYKSSSQSNVNQNDTPKRINRSSSLNSRSSSTSSRSSQAVIRKLDTIDDNWEFENRSSTVSSPLSKSLHGIPCETDEVSSLERQSISLPSNSSIPMVTPLIVGKRIVNVGVFRNLERFPFGSQTFPTPSCNRLANRREYSPSERLFVRPQMFGEVLRYQRRRPIHFGPPRNPQCSCESCLAAWSRFTLEGGCNGRENIEPVDIKAWSLSDLGGPDTSSSPLPHSSSPTLSINTASDISALPHLGKPFGFPQFPSLLFIFLNPLLSIYNLSSIKQLFSYEFAIYFQAVKFRLHHAFCINLLIF